MAGPPARRRGFRVGVFNRSCQGYGALHKIAGWKLFPQSFNNLKGLARPARHPEHVCSAVIIQPPCEYEQVVGETVDVLDRLWVDLLLGGKPGYAPFGAARDGAGKMQPRGRLAATRQDEGIQRLKVGVHGVDLFLQPLDLRGHDAQRLLAALALAFGRAEIGAEIEQVVLEAAEHGIGLGEPLAAQHGAGDRAARQPDDRIGFVGRAVGFYARIVLGNTVATAKRSLSAVAAARVDAGECDHRLSSGWQSTKEGSARSSRT